MIEIITVYWTFSDIRSAFSLESNVVVHIVLRIWIIWS
jgi:hypothetical protein